MAIELHQKFQELHQSFQVRERFDLLDGVRALAILAVMWHHSVGSAPFELSFFERGYLGVDLFFVLSGFLITHLLLKEKRVTGTVSLKNFYIRRSLRIFPLYYAYIFGLLCLAWFSNREKFDEMLPILPYYLFYVSNFVSPEIPQFFERAWSLAVEEQFYLLWPTALAAFGISWATRIIVPLFAVSVLASLGFLGGWVLDVSTLVVPHRTILIGCFLALGFASPAIGPLLHRYLFRSYCAPVLFVGMAIYIALLQGPIQGFNQIVVHLLMAAFLASCLVNEDNPMKRIFRPALMRTFGKVSYGMYILHGQFWGATKTLVGLIPVAMVAQSRITFFVVFTLITLVVSLLSYHFFEAFFLKLKHRFGWAAATAHSSTKGKV